MFVFSWGGATVTLEDVAVLGELPLLGKFVCEVLSDELRGNVHTLEGIRSKSKKPKYSSWVKYFLERPQKSDADPGGMAAGL